MPGHAFDELNQLDLFEREKSSSVSAYIEMIDREYLERSSKLESRQGLPF